MSSGGWENYPEVTRLRSTHGPCLGCKCPWGQTVGRFAHESGFRRNQCQPTPVRCAHVVGHARETMYVLADALDDLTLVAARD